MERKDGNDVTTGIMYNAPPMNAAIPNAGNTNTPRMNQITGELPDNFVSCIVFDSNSLTIPMNLNSQ